ncbi:MAG: hypothetical protein AAF624_18830 [Bacteroidota bacterium]
MRKDEGRKGDVLNSAANVLIPAILALRAMGYDVSRRYDGGREWWKAQTEMLEFGAEDPLSLLGLVALRERRGAKWRASDAEIDAVMQEFGLNG